MGFKLFLFPFFIIIIFTLSGFSKPQKTNIDSLMLFDACFGYVNRYEVNTPDLEFNLPPENQSDELFISSLDFIGAFNDSIDIPDSVTVIDSTLSVLNDSLLVNIGLDSTMVDSLAADSLAIDSTARLKYFRFQRTDVPYLRLKEPARSKFFAYPSQALLNRSIQLDSTGQFVIIREEIAKGEYREYLKIPLEDFIAFQLQKRNRDIWEELGSKYEIKSEKKEFGQLLTDITNIEIPLPSSSIFSIFGPPKINIRINGAVDIHGAWRNETTEGVTVSALGNTRNEPDFKQKVQINVSGTIGDKLTIAADWNTERTFQYENQLKLKYTGYEDEIIQSIEAGNVSLQTSPLVGGSEALFGIKSHFKMGPFSLTAIASQKKGEIQEVSLNSGAQSQTFEIHAYEYSQNHYFLDAVYADPNLNVFNLYYGNPVPIVLDSIRVKDIEVWKTITGLPDPNERTGNAYIDLPRRSRSTIYDEERDIAEIKQTIPGQQYIRQRFVKLNEGADYRLHPETGFVTFSTQIQAPDAIAVAYRIEGPTLSADDDIYYGEFLQDVSTDSTATIVLKLIKPPNLQPGYGEAWKLQLRNIYPVGGRDVKEEGFVLDVQYIIDGQEPQNNYQGTKLLEVFELDKTDPSGTSTTPDGAFDFVPGRTIFPFTGEIVFPVLQPFGDNFPEALPDTLKYNAVYDTTVTFAKQDRAKDKFIMVGEYSAAVSSVYSIGFNVVENSVRVTLNGQELIEGIDYSVDYNIGQITIRNDQALVPGADLRITYEQNDLFQLASKTLLGLRGIYEFNKNTRLGFSLLDLNQQTLSDKVRIGEEPLNNMILGADFETKVELPFITKGLDQIISTKEMSTLTLRGEYAYMSPDPNTKKSKIEGDNGASIAYVDDFEGAKRIIPVGINYSGWKDLSVPNRHPDPLIGNTPTSVLINSKARSYWFNILPSDVTIYDIWGDRREAARENQQVTVLDWDYDPNLPGFYNWNPDLFVPGDNWGGMMTKLSSTANNLIEENIEFIEFWMKIIQAPANAKIYVDLGQISEDVIPNQRLDTEDKNQNDLVDEGEDTGLDGLLDIAEPNYDAINNPDPSLDNYEFLLGSGIFSGVNGTQGNAVSLEQGRLPDTEDMNRNFTLDLVNSYFRYEVVVDTVRANNPLIAGGGDNAGWYLIRIPLKDHIDEIGDPTFSVVESIRFITTGISERMHLRFAEINLVGNQWQKVIDEPRVTIDDEVLSVSTINVEDNPEYVMPPGLERERDRSETEATVFKNEQSLRLVLNDLDDGDNREVVKYLFRPLDLFNYREMKLYVHGDLDTIQGSVSHFVDENNYGAEVYFRFGADSLNFYEYRQPVRADWNEIRLLFSELTAIKQSRPSDSLFYQVPLEGLPGHFYGVKGKPTLTRITFFTIGILNPKDKGMDGENVSGEIWVNELRVLNADDTPGWALTASTSFKLADLLNVNFNISQTDPYFHKLAERFGTRVEARNWAVSADLDVLKLIPVNLSGSNLHVGYQRSESMSKPLYVPGTDISVDQAVKELEQKLINEGAEPEIINEELDNFKKETETKSVSETWTISNVKIKIPSDAWYIKHTINSLTFGYNLNRKSSRNPTTISNTSWLWNANIAYALNLGNSLYFSLADIPIINYIFDILPDYKNMKVFYTPQTFNMGLSASRKRSFILSRTAGSEPNIQRDFTAIRTAAFSWKFTEGSFFNWALNYNLNISSSLAYLLVDENENERSESKIWGDIFGGAMFGRDFDFRQSFDLKTRPMLPTFWDLNRHIMIDAGYNASYNWRNNFQQEELGKSAGFNTRFTTSFTIKWKDLFAPLFEDEEEITERKPPSPTQPGGGRRGEDREDTRIGRRGRDSDRSTTPEKTEEDSLITVIDTAQSIIPDSLTAPTEEIEEDEPGMLATSLNSLKLAAKYIFFDYDQFRINFSQNNSNTASGLRGDGTGFNNFWGVNYSSSKGPSRAYMLGLSRNPGPRAVNGNLSDNFSQKNQIDFSTKRSLWEGAEIDLNWNVAWGITKSISLNTDSVGTIEITNITSTGTIDRSFFTVPPVFFLSFIGNGIKKVAELYNPNSPNPNLSLANAFVEGFESLPILSKIPFLKDVGKYIPRPNWTFNWTGLEKISFFNWAKRISINHAYISSYSEGWKVNPDGLQEIQTQRIEYGFSPLIGLNISFDEVLGGNLTSNIKFSSKTAYNLGASTKNVTETFSRDIAISASYSRSGFEFPLFGVSLKNDLEISFSYTSGKNSVVIFLMDEFSEDGKPQDGTTRTIIEPRVKYVMSSRVTLSLFYRRTSIEPEGAARIPPTTTNEAGLDVHISIQ